MSLLQTYEGTHHAFPSGGSGYCILNDLAVTAEVLLNEGKVSRVLILDLDVHQGDGTAACFSGREDVFTLSVHCESNFPSRSASIHKIRVCLIIPHAVDQWPMMNDLIPIQEAKEYTGCGARGWGRGQSISVNGC